ncbi:MAG: M48 family metallopeptidase [Desulfobacterales bacterium]|nr:M48 family metallopeptidase [Desulfobacterales bacterium]
MNIIAVIILAALLADACLNIVADSLNLKRARLDPPEAFKAVYDARRHDRSLAYLRANTRFGWVTTGAILSALLIFWFGGGFPLLDAWVRSLNQEPVASGLLYIGCLAILSSALSLPFTIYDTFVIETRFGFNKTTWSTFIMDRIKGILLLILLGAPLLAGVLAFFEYAGPNAWWWCWIVVTVYMLAVQIIVPQWIMPLYNKFDPIEPGPLKSAVMEYARSIRFPLEDIYVMDGSRRSSKSNAFFTGFGKNKKIVLFDTLIQRHTVPELVAILAHEMGHFKKKHILQSTILGVLQAGFMLYLLSLFISFRPLFDAFYMDAESVYAGIVFFAMLYAPIDFFTGVFVQMLSRRNEYAADRFSAETTGDARPLANALIKLSADNLSNPRPHPFYVFLNHSHPPATERIKALQRA